MQWSSCHFIVIMHSRLTWQSFICWNSLHRSTFVFPPKNMLICATLPSFTLFCSSLCIPQASVAELHKKLALSENWGFSERFSEFSSMHTCTNKQTDIPLPLNGKQTCLHHFIRTQMKSGLAITLQEKCFSKILPGSLKNVTACVMPVNDAQDCVETSNSENITSWVSNCLVHIQQLWPTENPSSMASCLQLLLLCKKVKEKKNVVGADMEYVSGRCTVPQSISWVTHI